ncbi:hypothetical protein NUACC21_00860 [Scytonema sp. NUACC21]
MTLSKQEMPNQNYFLETEQTLHYNIEEQVMQLFAASSQSTSLEKEIDEIINDFSQDFLSTFDTNTYIHLDSLLDKFCDSQIPVNPTNLESYLKYLGDNVIAHSIHTSSPRFIGHMTSALPSFVRPLAKLMTAMNQNSVKIETAKALSSQRILRELFYNLPDFSNNLLVAL